MSNIKTELSSLKKKEAIEREQDNAVKTVLLLENSESAEDLRIANSLGANHSIARAQNSLGAKLNIEKLDSKYAGNVFEKSKIKELAKRYNMRFLQSHHYCGNLDLEVISKIKAFSKETNVQITEANLKYNFYILAPEECFNLKKMERRKVDPDPAIFYKIDESHYRLIHQWGSDFNILNRINGFAWQSRNSRFVYLAIINLLICALLLTGMYKFDIASSGWQLTWTIFFPIVAILLPLITTHSDIYHDQDFHEDKWNNDIKITR